MRGGCVEKGHLAWPSSLEKTSKCACASVGWSCYRYPFQACEILSIYFRAPWPLITETRAANYYIISTWPPWEARERISLYNWYSISEYNMCFNSNTLQFCSCTMQAVAVLYINFYSFIIHLGCPPLYFSIFYIILYILYYIIIIL